MKIKSIFFTLFTATVSLWACKDNPDVVPTFQQETETAGLIKPIRLNPVSTTVNLSDLFPNFTTTDSIAAPTGLKVKQNGQEIELTVTDALPNLSVLSIYINGISYDVALMKSQKVAYNFVFSTEKQYEKVQLAGDINAWNPANTTLTKTEQGWETTLWLTPGKYQYQVVLDGQWKLNPNAPKVSNGIGGENSLLTIEASKIAKPAVFSVSTNNNLLTFRAENNPEKIIFLIDNQEITSEFDSKNRLIKVTIPKIQKTRTFLRVFAANKAGFAHDILIPLQNGKVITNTDDLTRKDFEAATLYNVFVDRFFDGNPDNNRPTPDPEIHPRANYHGGDISGVIEKIKSGYFNDLGINTIWISPIVKNPEGAYGQYPEPKTKFSAYHGYWPISFTEVDNRLTSEEKLKELVKTAHENNMNVLLDFVANHVHEAHPVYQANKDWATDLYLPDGTLNTEKWDEHRLTTWFDTFLPTLNLEKPEVYNMLTDSALFWLEKYQFDGFRHDATKHIPTVFWKTLTQKINTRIASENNRIYQIGETYGTPELISSYLTNGQLDGQFDFNVYDAIVNTLVDDSTHFKRLTETLNTSFEYYGTHNLMGNITGNQDRARFMAYASKALRFDEDAKHAGWNREIKVEDPVGYKKATLLNTIVATIPGLPVIFYGDEIGMVGGNDPDNRRMMRFDNLKEQETKLKKHTQTVLNTRRSSMALNYGNFNILHQTENTLVYARSYFEKTALIFLNKSAHEKTIRFNLPDFLLDTNYRQVLENSNWKIENGKIQITMPAYSSEILVN